ncbi:glycosyltransferase family 4 protein [Amnibacterium flavum]|uniref:Glycosyltransferase family 1 protein n=1 Tax=Amnibacterium flavum TaxID=2173173 RepID=A0A2V1HVQ6_9MICO|nr:glycosyltransferase family 1 protein [Amnibacterium flavum]PVZ95842.1 glycosyltransferase family 1 protein [Amnibacterium flavum]
MVTLRVVLENILEASPRGIARYSEELTRALIEHAPRDCNIEGIVAAATAAEYERLEELLPGLSGLHKLALPRREVRAAWQHGFTTRPLGGMVHSPSLLAPLTRHDRASSPGEQTVVTIHDAAPWLYPQSSSVQSKWVLQMAGRARRHADAIVVPTHAVADELADRLGLGDRLRVIGGAVSSNLTLPDNADEIAERLALPSSYVLTVGTLEPRKAVDALFAAAALPDFHDLPVIFVGPPAWGERTVDQAIVESGAPTGAIRHIDSLPDHELAVVIDRATVYIAPSLHEGFGLSAIEALHFGTPLIHSDAPALLEVVGDAGVVVERFPSESYPERLAEAIAATVGDATALERLAITGLDRAKAFSWRDSAERVWQLHADL